MKIKHNKKKKLKTFSKKISCIFFILLLFSGCAKKSDINSSFTKTEAEILQSVSSGEQAPELTIDNTEDINYIEGIDGKNENNENKDIKNIESKLSEDKKAAAIIGEMPDKSHEDKNNESISTEAEKTIKEGTTQANYNTITLSIMGPKDRGSFMMPETVRIKSGDTVYDILKRALEQKRIPFEYSGKKNSIYIESINNVGEFDYGQQSGWIYKVNGIMPNISAGEYEIKDKDIIEWFYTVNLGKEYIGK